jgi:tripartite-type tricarboxylate transporter receptor subunit TctC
MRLFVQRFVLTILIGFASVSVAKSEDWPTRNISVVIPLPPGVASDTTARIVFEQVGRQVGESFVIQNRPGAGGIIGANVVAKSPPDGYTALVYGSLAAATALYSKLPFDTLKDFAPVVPFGQQPLAIVAPPGRFKDLADLLARAKAKPGELNFASAGVGSAAHFGAERLITSAGIQVQHVPFKGGDYFTEIIAGRVDFTVAPLTTMINLIRDGKVTALAVSAKKRSLLLPQVPTLIEAGLSSDSVYPFYSPVFLPAGTPRSIIEKLHDEVTRALAMPSVHERLVNIGMEPMPMSVAEFETFFRDDVKANISLVQAAKIPQQE